MNIYADHAATTKMSRRAIEVMLPYMDQIYGNPSSLHSYGQRGAEALQNAREQMAKGLGCSPREITFVSGGSEADNQAVLSAARREEGEKAYCIHRLRASCGTPHAGCSEKAGI